MSKEKIKVYLYTRVSTSIQIEGYSLEAQKSRMKALLFTTIMKLLESMKMPESLASLLKVEFSSIEWWKI